MITLKREFILDGMTVTVTAEKKPGQKREWKKDQERKPTSTGMDEVLMGVLTADYIKIWAPESEREQLEQGCWAGGLAYALATDLQHYLAPVLIFDDEPETR